MHFFIIIKMIQYLILKCEMLRDGEHCTVPWHQCQTRVTGHVKEGIHLSIVWEKRAGVVHQTRRAAGLVFLLIRAIVST